LILTVTANLALDITYEVPRLVPGAAHRVRRVHQRAGGKGVNVARVLRALGHRPVLAGLVGGPTGAAIRAELAETGLAEALTPISGESRRTVTVVSDPAGAGATGAEATMFTEPGPLVSTAEWADFVAGYTELVATATVVVLSGSLPPGVPDTGYRQLIEIATWRGARSVLDTSRPALTAALAAGPDVVKPNAAELRAATGIADELVAARELSRSGVGAVVASLGPGGLLAITADGCWRARPPHAFAGNPTGAGDACVAAIAIGMSTAASWPKTLVTAVAASTASVVCPVAGEIDLGCYRRLLAEVGLEELDAAHPHR
jgi:tagatose 6-phosphate kinase